MSDEHKRLWFQAYCAAMEGLVSAHGSKWNPGEFADTAIHEYHEKFGSDSATDGAYEGWAHLEIMGHRSYYGRVREIRAYGTSLIEIQCLNDKGELTDERHQYGGGAIFHNGPMDEATCRHEAQGERKVRCHHYDAKTQLRCASIAWTKGHNGYCSEHEQEPLSGDPTNDDNDDDDREDDNAF